ncbi:MAG: RNA pseudouridine synthase [Eubacterium sp.]|nr:RNA pseudouridine synthase [Eubacterium sp.]
MIAVNKPYGMPSQPDKTYGLDLITAVKEYLYETAKTDKDENEEGGEEPYLAIINRLDRPVAGIVLMAKDEETAAKLSDMVQDREISKYYQAVIRGSMKEPEGELSGYLLHDKKLNVSKMVPKGTKGAKKAELYYEVLDELDTDEGEISYLLIELLTGRHHQIRCQLADNGTPIWGDSKYGGNPDKASNKNISKNSNKNSKNKASGSGSSKEKELGLFSTMMEFEHPVTGEMVTLHREPEGKAFDIMDQMDW